jgi:hypothetical protein
MTITQLQSALVERMTTVADAFWRFETKKATRAPRVVAGWLPAKTPDGEEFPFVIVRLRTGTDGDEDARATADLLIGTYSDTDDGFADVLLLIDAIRDSLGSTPVVGDCFECVPPLTWELLDEQPRPQWFGRVTATFVVPRPQRTDGANP